MQSPFRRGKSYGRGIKIKLLYLINHAGKAGTERYVEALATGLDITPYFAYNESGLLVERMENASVPIWQIEMKSRFDFVAARKVARFCRKNDIDVIHTHYLRENYIALLSRLFYPKPRVVYTNHILLQNDLITRISNRILSLLQYRVIAVCSLGKTQMIANGIPERLIDIVYNGIDPKLWACDRQFGGAGSVLPKELTFIYAARVVDGKGHKTILNAAALIKDKPFKIILAGDGDLLDRMRELSERLELGDKVTFTGFCREVKPLLAAADIEINASESETLSMNILEAMAAGLPIIATDAGGNPELLNTGCGIQVPVNDARAMADAMLIMLESPELREKYSQAALAAANGIFNISTMLKRTKELYGG
jgi:glycosyltransferase involved in cell wall biosynthesis